MAERLQVDANLVGAAGLNADREQSEPAVGAFHALQHLPVRDGGAAAGAARGHAGAAHGVAADGQGDGAGVLRGPAVHQREVALAQAALAEHLAELAVREIVLGDDDEAAGLLVQPVDDAGAQIAAYLREPFAEVEEQSVDQRAAVVFRGAGAGVDHHAGGLVDDGEIGILIDDGERYVLRRGVERLRLGVAFNLDELAAFEFVAGLAGFGVDGDLAVFDEQHGARAADVGDGFGEVGVEANTIGGGLGGEAADAVPGFEIFEDLDAVEVRLLRRGGVGRGIAARGLRVVLGRHLAALRPGGDQRRVVRPGRLYRGWFRGLLGGV